LIGDRRAFSCPDWRAEQYASDRGIHRKRNNAWPFLPQEKRLVNCRTLSRVVCRCSVEQRIDTWAMRPTQRMRSGCTLSAYKHLDQFRGQAQMSTWLVAIVSNVRGCNYGEGHGRSTSLSTSNSETKRDTGFSERLVHFGRVQQEEYRKAELHGHLMQFVEELSPPLRRHFNCVTWMVSVRVKQRRF